MFHCNNNCDTEVEKKNGTSWLGQIVKKDMRGMLHGPTQCEMDRVPVSCVRGLSSWQGDGIWAVLPEGGVKGRITAVVEKFVCSWGLLVRFVPVASCLYYRELLWYLCVPVCLRNHFYIFPLSFHILSFFLCKHLAASLSSHYNLFVSPCPSDLLFY